MFRFEQEKEKTMSPDLSKEAVMRVEKGEEIFGGWATAPIPQVGIYKLLAKTKTDGTIEWAHFVQRSSGVKEKVIRGTVETGEEFAVVKNAMDNNLRRIFGVTLQEVEFDIGKLDKKKAAGTLH
jgi:hypothetical protein